MCVLWQLLEIDRFNKSINLENACEYFATRSLLLVGQVPPLVVISCFSVLLCLSSILQSYIKWFDDWVPSLHGHIGLSIILNLWRYDFVFPCPDTIAVNSDVIGILSFSLWVLPTVVRRCVWPRNLVNEEAIACVGPQHHKKKKWKLFSRLWQ